MASNITSIDLTWEFVPYIGIIFKPAPNDRKFRYRMYNNSIIPNMMSGFFTDKEKRNIWWYSDTTLPLVKVVDILIEKGAIAGAISMRKNDDLCFTVNF